MLIMILFLVFSTAALIGYALIPSLYGKTSVYSERRQQSLSSRMERLMPRKEARKLSRFFVFAPVMLGATLYFVFPEGLKVPGLLIGGVGGFLFPGIYIKALSRQLKNKFNDQLVDALMIMSSSFRGGLSLVQAMEAVVDEMPDPINKEFGVVLAENKMGVSLEEALAHLYNRMPLVSLQQMITAILLARETGGNLPVIFNRIVNNIRESKKIQQNLATLTIQGQIQGVVMSLLPIGFGFIVYSSNRRIFEHMLTSDLGRGMLIYALISWLIGAFFVWKISTFKDF